jgi:hypothetical protein
MATVEKFTLASIRQIPGAEHLAVGKSEFACLQANWRAN